MLTRSHSLMLAVLEQAVLDLASPSASIRGRARGWFLTFREDYLFAFSRICREFGYDPSLARARLFASAGLVVDDSRPRHPAS